MNLKPRSFLLFFYDLRYLGLTCLPNIRVQSHGDLESTASQHDLLEGRYQKEEGFRIFRPVSEESQTKDVRLQSFHSENINILGFCIRRLLSVVNVNFGWEFPSVIVEFDFKLLIVS